MERAVSSMVQATLLGQRTNEKKISHVDIFATLSLSLLDPFFGTDKFLIDILDNISITKFCTLCVCK
jgi:hypothetical protein